MDLTGAAGGGAPPMSLIAFHRVLIVTGIIFCFGFGGWELVLWWVTRRSGSLVLGLTFLVLGGLLLYYLTRLGRFLGYEEDGRRR